MDLRNVALHAMARYLQLACVKARLSMDSSNCKCSLSQEQVVVVLDQAIAMRKHKREYDVMVMSSVT